MAALLLAVGAAFNTSAMNKKAALLGEERGFIRINNNINMCSESILCKTEPGDLCTTGVFQVWKKNSANQCVIELHKIE